MSPQLLELPKVASAASTEVERGVIDLFMSVADLLGLPRSVGALYGALFVSPRPMHMDELREHLRLSKGATSQGLRLLRGFGAVRVIRKAEDRRDYFVAEDRLRPLLGGFLREQVQPHLRNGTVRIRTLKAAAAKAPPEMRDFLEERIERLENWHRRSERLLPVVIRLIRA